ncbi:MAG: MFS transporter [Candidatus Krumholzibacteriia bacterium]
MAPTGPADSEPRAPAAHTAAPAPPLHPVIRATGWVSFFTDLGSELIYPLLPDFVTVTLHASRRTFGLIEGLAEGMPSIVKLWSGALADRARSRKGLIFAGYLLSSVVKPFIGMAQTAGGVLGLRLIDKIGQGVRGAPRDAVVADFAGGQRGRAFGYQRAMDHAGAVAGGLVGFLLLRVVGVDLRLAIMLSAIPGLLALLVIALFVRDDPARRDARAHARAHAAGGPASARLPLSREFRCYLVAAVLFALANSSDAFLILRAREMGLPLLLAPLAWALLHVVKSVTSLWGGVLSDRVGRRPVLLAGWVLYALVYGAFAWLTAVWAAWLLFAAYGVFFGATEGVAKAFVADLVPSAARGRAFGLLGLCEGLALIPTSFAIGWLWDATGSGRAPLAIEAALALLAAGWLALACRGTRARPLPA